MPQTKEQEKSPEKELSKMEASNLPRIEVKKKKKKKKKRLLG